MTTLDLVLFQTFHLYLLHLIGNIVHWYYIDITRLAWHGEMEEESNKEQGSSQSTEITVFKVTTKDLNSWMRLAKRDIIVGGDWLKGSTNLNNTIEEIKYGQFIHLFSPDNVSQSWINHQGRKRQSWEIEMLILFLFRLGSDRWLPTFNTILFPAKLNI